jgi:hypothetical protein
VTTLGRRILWRAVPVGVAAALVGFGLRWFYLSQISQHANVQLEYGGPSYIGPLVLGLIAFAAQAAIEYVRR